MPPSLHVHAPADVDEVPDAWYLQVVTEATAAHLAALDHPPATLAALGVVHRAVRTDLDWAERVAPGAQARVVLATAHVGHTSMTLDARVESGPEDAPVPACHVRTVHVVLVAGAPATRAEVPETLRAALGPARPIKPQGRAARG